MLKSKGLNWLLAIVSIFIASTAFSQNLQISGGNSHTVAICESGDIFAWGKNTSGQLGPLGPAGFSNTPVLVTGFPAGMDIKQTDAGSGSHTLALGCDGTVWAWGENGTGQLGNGTAGSFSAAPQQVVGIGGTGFLTGVKYVSGGNDESFAIMNDGRLVSWGQNDRGQLGDGTITSRNFPSYVLKCGGGQLTGVIQVESGDENCYALLSDGTVWSWGDDANNGGAALGRPPAVNPHCAQQVVYGDNTDAGFTTTAVTNIVSISAGDRHLLMLDGTGTVWSLGGDWGVGQLGQGKGYQKSAHKVLAPKPFNSPWTTDPYTIDQEFNTGPYLTGVTSISAGQAHSMAVLADGRMVTWGANGFFDCGTDCAYVGGQLGIGMTLGNKTGASDPGKGVEGPVYALTAAGTQLQNVVSVSDGDAISIAVLANGDVYIAGSNSYGQVGIGSGGSAAGDRSTVLYFQKITIPTCTFSVPCPIKPRLGADFEKCPLVSQTLYANVAPRSTYNYSWEYSATGTAPWTVMKNVIAFPTANADNLVVTTNGYYRLIITDDRATLPANCAPCAPAGDTIRILDPVANFGDPGDLTFCGTTATVHVTETGPSATTTGSTYEWYAANTGGTALATTIDIATASLTVSTLTMTGTAPNRVATAWVEDKSTFTATVATKTEITETTPQNYGKQRINFIPIKSFSLNSVQVEWVSYGATTTTLALFNAGGTQLATGISPAVAYGGTGAQINTSTVTFSTTPSLAAGGSYYITSTETIRQYDVPGNAYTTNFQNAGIDILDIVSTSDVNGSNVSTTLYPAFFSWNVTVGSPYPCGRLKVLITEKCPACVPPTSVAITPTTQTLCAGANLTIAGTVTLSATAPTGAYQYTWYKGTYSAANIVSGPSATYSDFTKTGVAAADAGTYTLRVEDYTAPGANATCYKEASVVITVNAITVPGVIAATQVICTGDNPAAFTVTTAASGGDGTTYTYQWQSDITTTGTFADITTGGTGATYDEGVLTNTGTTAKVISYRRKVTSGVCPQVISNVITITVNPPVVAGAVATDQTVCSGGDPAAFTQTTAPSGGSGTYTYKWQSSTTNATTGFADIAPAATGATYDAPTGLTVTTWYRRVDGSGTCATANTTAIKVTIPPTLVPGVVAADQTICYNTAPAAFTSTSVASGGDGTYAYQWQTSTALAGTYTDISGETNATLTDATLLTADKYYRRKVTSGTVATCNVAYSNIIHVTVSPIFVVGSIVTTTQTICTGTAPTILASATLPSGGKTPYTYQWQSSPDNGTTAWANVTGGTGATGTSYTPGTLTSDMYYRRSDISAGGCGTLYTTSVKITVDPVVTQATITADQAICSGATPSLIGGPVAAGGSTTATATYVWENSVSPFTTWNVIGTATGKDYQPPALTAETWYRRTDKKGTCAGVVSTIVKMTITSLAPATVTLSRTPTGTICEGTNVDFTASAGNGGTPTYEWFVKTGAGAFVSQGVASSAVGADKFSSSTLLNGDIVKVTIVSSLSCASPATASDQTTMVVTTKVTPTISITASKTTICTNEAVTFSITSQANEGTAPNGPKYQWTQGGSNIAGATNATYVAPVGSITTGDVFNIIMTTGLTCVTSATATATTGITITVTPTPVLTVTAGSSLPTICSGQTVIFTATPAGTGSTPTPTYEWFIGAAGSEVSSSTANPFSTTSLTTTAALSPQTYSIYVKALSTATCASTTPAQSAPITVVVNAGVGAGTITTATSTICYDAVPGAITESGAAVGVGAATYTWEETTDPVLVPWGTATGTVNGTGFTPSGQKTGDIYYRRTVTFAGVPTPCNTSQSNTVHFIVRPQLVAGIIGTSLTTCSGTATATMSETTAPTGGTGTFTYQWQSAPDVAGVPGTFTNITPGGTSATYNAGSLTSTMHYQLIETSGTCGSVTTNIVTKTVASPEVVTVSINDPGQVCDGSTAFNFVATASSTGAGTLTYVWSKTNPLTGVVTVVGTNSSSYSYSPVAGDDNFVIKVVVTTSTGCNAGPATSNLVTLDIVTATTPTVTISTIHNPNCAGYTSTFTLTSTGGGNNPTYQWYRLPFGSATPQPVGTGGTTFSSSTLLDKDQIYVELTSSLGCIIGTNPFPSNKILMQIKQIPDPSIVEGDQTICSPNTFTFHGNVTANNTYEWRLNGTTVVGTNPDLTATQSGTYTLFEDNGTCNAISQPVVLTIVQTPQANAGTDMYMKEGDSGNLNGSGGSVYNWTPSTYLSNAAVSNPSFTATTTITYILTVSDPVNPLCATSDDVTVFVVKPVEVPNVITVNGDGSNDDWEIKNIEGYPNVIIEIYNRWGNLVWKTEGYPKNWDGTNFRNGQVLPDGTYFYIINLQSQVYDEPLTGWVQIMK